MGRFLPPHGIGRRAFLRAVGTVTGAVALAGARPGVAQAMTPPSGPAITRVGLLAPQSPRGVARSLETGMRLALNLAQAGARRFDLVVGETDAGLNSLLTGATKLLEQDRVELLVGMAGPQLTDRLAPLLARTGTRLLALDTGANAIRLSEQHSEVIYHTLGYWQSAWALGQWAAQNLGRKGFIVSSFLESGYDAIDAFQIGLETAGGAVAETKVTHVQTGPDAWETVMDAIRQARPDFVFAQYSNDLAVAFVNSFTSSGLAASIPLLGSPWLVDEAVLPRMGAAALGVKSVHCWAPDLAVPENAAFVSAYRQMTGTAPNSFAALGYDTARLIMSAQAAGRMNSPRGWVRHDEATQSVSMPLFLREVRQGPSGPVNTVIEPVTAPAADDPRLAPLRSGTRTGWFHPHLG